MLGYRVRATVWVRVSVRIQLGKRNAVRVMLQFLAPSLFRLAVGGENQNAKITFVMSTHAHGVSIIYTIERLECLKAFRCAGFMDCMREYFHLCGL